MAVDIRVLELRACDLALQKARRERPDGFRCGIADRPRGAEVTIEAIERALRAFEAVAMVSHPTRRKLLGMISATLHGEPVFTRAEVAAKLQLSLRTFERQQRIALDEWTQKLRDLIAKRDMPKSAA